MKNQLIEYFSFGKAERIAIITVITLIILLVLLPSVYNRFRKPVVVKDSMFDKEIADFLKQEEAQAATTRSGFDFTNPDREIVRQTIMPFEFDPNTLDAAGWQKLGFSEKQAAGVVKYREKGGSFRKNEDLKKLFIITAEIYKTLEPFLRIEEKKENQNSNPNTKKKASYASGNKPVKYQAELNSADSAELVKVYGIGPATARRIIKYREKLGGYASVEQLREVTGIDSARYEMIKSGVFTDATVITGIDVNKLSVTQLRQHPYIDYYVAKAIVDNRIKKGSYSSPDELKEIPLIYDAL
ncbi:MAG: helix-hairpin-helix domain-containing protein, partial [Lentimicrobium sp.]|nr:helix-hairpin-helix domain-containing protein [Lentimicrobium sp.]